MSSILERISGANSNPNEKSHYSRIMRENFHKLATKDPNSDNSDRDADISGDVNPLMRANVEKHVDVPNSLTNRITRHFVFRINKSMNDIEADTKYLTCNPISSSIFKTHSRYSPTAAHRSPDLKGDLSQVVILGAEVVSYKNGFPVPLNVSFVDGSEKKEFPAFRGNFREVATGERVHYSMPPLGECGNVNRPINLTSPFIHSSYIEKYKGLVSEEALRTKGISRNPEFGTVMVSTEHPIINVILSNDELLNVDADQLHVTGQLNSKTKKIVPVYNINEDLVNVCMDVLVEDLHDNLPLFNIDGLRMKISRPGVSDGVFAKSDEVVFEPEIARLHDIKNTDNTSKYTQYNVNRSLDVVCAITYAFLGE